MHVDKHLIRYAEYFVTKVSRTLLHAYAGAVALPCHHCRDGYLHVVLGDRRAVKLSRVCVPCHLDERAVAGSPDHTCGGMLLRMAVNLSVGRLKHTSPAHVEVGSFRGRQLQGVCGKPLVLDGDCPSLRPDWQGGVYQPSVYQTCSPAPPPREGGRGSCLDLATCARCCEGCSCSSLDDHILISQHDSLHVGCLQRCPAQRAERGLVRMRCAPLHCR